MRELSQEGDNVRIMCPFDDKEYIVERLVFHPLIKGGDSKAFILSSTNRRVLFPYDPSRGSGSSALVPIDQIHAELPLTWAFLNTYRDYLERREDGKMKGPNWYGYVYPKAIDVMQSRKIFTPDIAPKASFSYDDTGEVFFTGGGAGGYGLIPSDDMEFEDLLGLLNSTVLDWYLRRISTSMRGGWYSYESRYISRLPIPENSLQRRNQLIPPVQTILDLHRRRSEVKTSHDKTLLDRQIDATTLQINRIVYELYDLSDADIAVVEGRG